MPGPTPQPPGVPVVESVHSRPSLQEEARGPPFLLLIIFTLISPPPFPTSLSLFSSFFPVAPKLKCIRPPRRQSGQIFFLKTSVCADGSQQLHETNMINNCYSKPLRNFFLEDIFIFCGFLGFFLCLKTLFWFFIMKNFLVTHIFKCLTVQNHHYGKDQPNFVKKILK